MLRIEIDGRWSAQDFVDFYESMDSLYSILALVQIERESSQDIEYHYRRFIEIYSDLEIRRRYGYPFSTFSAFWNLSQGAKGASRFKDAAALLLGEERLMVRRCNYASPGFADITGAGEAIGHLTDLASKCIDVRLGRRERELREKLLEQQIEGAALDNGGAALRNLETYLRILESCGYTKVEIRQILADANPYILKLEGLAFRGLITGAKEIEDQG